ncbi:unnamed protein product [Penicillium salamii]|uniref:Uncharacterized protein n=1 Tax=Penicillium salamii TaxID=1612424 RepID=A0A9W4NZB8_9EURO|nr:unnamed protein product [Penicillium salamii]CAG7953438.1 unnamed protein product [Penicillium salamii]CAG8003232.1 unnamed protein product [Penicillium salamii]CAG8046584.1 unnamed protein product [Penicillium salamii]CAG8136246.1 unnamed protein product [Penicillium salamii]
MGWSGIYPHLLSYASPFLKHREKPPLLPCCYQVPSSLPPSQSFTSHYPHRCETFNLRGMKGWAD